MAKYISIHTEAALCGMDFISRGICEIRTLAAFANAKMSLASNRVLQIITLNGNFFSDASRDE